MRILGLAAIAAASLAMSVSTAFAQQPAAACISDAARATVAECPRAVTTTVASPASSAGPQRAQVRRVERQQEAAQGPRGPEIRLTVAERMNRERTQVRALDLLRREIEILRRLVQNTRRDNPQRPEILLRLAETYFEQQQAVNTQLRSQDEPRFAACGPQGTPPPNAADCQRISQLQTTLETELNEARQAGNRTYATLIQDHPDFRRMDEVIFSLAFGLQEVGQQEQARQVYYRLIKGYPESRFIPHAYLAFAEYYFDQAQMDASLQFYQQVLQFPPDRNSVYGYALYKSAWVQYNREDFRASLQAFADTIEFGTTNPHAVDGANLARQSRRELVMPYSRVGTPERALDFFTRYSRDREQALDMLSSLADLYFDTGQWDKAIYTYHKLMAEQPNSDHLCTWESRITSATISSRGKPQIVEELRNLVRVYETFVATPNRPEEATNECKAGTAGVLFSLATAWHVEALGTDEAHPGTNDRDTMARAADLYQLLVERFPDMEQLEFRDINREDWPSRYKVAYYYANLLYQAQEWARCGPAFDLVVQLNPQGEYVNEAAYAAARCYYNVYETQYSGRERATAGEEPAAGAAPASATPGRGRGRGRRPQQEAAVQTSNEFQPRDFNQLEQGMLRAFGNYVCVAQQTAEDMPTIKYRRARIYYEAHHYEEAAILFRDIAFSHRNSELAEYAANLYLDSLNILGTRRTPNNPSCIDDMEQAIQPMTQMYCSSASDRGRFADLCPVLDGLQCQVERKRAESLQGARRYRDAAEAYISIFRRNRELNRECGDIPEILHNAAIMYESARLVGSAIRVRRALINAYPEHELSKRAIYYIGANYHALAYYNDAAQWYEQFARTYPGETGASCTDAERTEGRCAVASEALMNATLFRLGLGQEEQAISDADLFRANYGRTMPRETATVHYAIGQLYEHQGRADKIVLYYRRYLRDFARTATPHELILANVAVGRAYLREEKLPEARGMFEAAVRLWTGGAPQAIARIESISQAEQLRMLREMIDATAEAMFFLAEDKFRAFQAIRFPRYEGGRSLARVNAWAQGDFMAWVNRKIAALQAAEREYAKIAELRLEVQQGVAMQSPAWQIAAAARSGQMYREFVDAFREAPIPEEIEADPELYGVYVDTLDQRSQPLLETATQRFLFCLRTATNVRWFNEWSRQCEAELSRLSPREYPVAAELRGSPNLTLETPGRPAAAELGAQNASDDTGAVSQ